jgi:NAD(P)-dependent dehydrogenase (short-subunit alcohol dehydrogenase family)
MIPPLDRDTMLKGKVVLACGATQGPGRTAARLFAAQGAWVAVQYRSDIVGAKNLVDQIRADGGRAIAVPGDPRSHEGAWTLARYVELEWAQVDVLLFAAAFAPPDDRAEDPSFIIGALAPGMAARSWGRIVVMGSPLSPSVSLYHTDLGAPHVLSNSVILDHRAEAGSLGAWAALLLGSGLNTDVTCATLEISFTGGAD